MKPKTVISIGNLTLTTADYDKSDLISYENSLYSKVVTTISKHCSDNVNVALKTTFGPDCRVDFYAAVLDKDGKTIARPAKMSIRTIEDTGELPANKTETDWRISILEFLSDQMNTVVNKSSSFDNVNDILGRIKNKDKEKPFTPVVVSNVESILRDPPRLIFHSLTPPIGLVDASNDPMLIRSTTTFAQDSLDAFTKPSVTKQWCEDGALWHYNSDDKRNEVLIHNCSFCQTTRSLKDKIVIFLVPKLYKILFFWK